MANTAPRLPFIFTYRPYRGSSHRLSKVNSDLNQPSASGLGSMFQTMYGPSAFWRFLRSFQVQMNATIPGTVSAADAAAFAASHKLRISSIRFLNRQQATTLRRVMLVCQEAAE